jgi:hypothetical protein
VPAPSIVIHRPRGIGFRVTVTFQGFIRDEGSSAPCATSITNALVLRVVD